MKSHHLSHLLALALLPAAAWSADPAAGTSKFSQNCASCHSVASTSSVDRGRNSPSMIRNAIGNVGAMGFLSSLSTSDLEDIAAYLGNTPSSLSFPATPVGQGSAAQVVTVRASRTAALSNLAVTVDGDFVRQGGTCGTTLAASSSCTVGVAFAPGASGSRTGTLGISHSGLSTPVRVALAGTGSAALQATLAVDSSSLAFGSQSVGATSAARSLTVSNSGTAALTFTSITVGGSAAGDYAAGGSCAVGTPVPAGGSCSVAVQFTPSATGSRTASLALASNASNGTATIALSGTGQGSATPAVTLSPSALAFGSVTVGSSSAAQAVTLRNSGTAPLGVTGIQASGPFSATHDCGSSLAPSASCTVSVVFTPTGAGAASGSLQVSSDAAGSPHAIGLAGTGLLAGTGALQWQEATPVAFGSVAVGSDAELQTRVLTNSGSVAAQIGSLALAGAQAGDFRIDSSSTCVAGQPLAAGASCQVQLGFVPTAAGLRAATLAVASSDAAVPAELGLSGTGTAPVAPVLSLSAETLQFTATSSGSAVQSLQIQNSGTAALQVTGLTLGNSRFTVAAAARQGCSTAPFTLAVGESCNVEITWLGTAQDPAEEGTLTVTSNAATASVTLSAEGERAEPANAGGGGCTLGAGTGAADPTLLLLAGLAGWLAWRRRRVA